MNFSPNLRSIEPAYTPDLLAEGVVASLTRRMGPRMYWRPIKTVLLGLLTGGLLPLLILPGKLRNFIIAEQTHLWHLAEWLRLQYPGTDAERLQEAVGKLRFRWALWIGSLILAALAVTWAWADLVSISQQPIVLVNPIGPAVTLQSLKPFTPQFLFAFTARLPHLVKEFASVPRMLIAAEGFMLLLIAAHVVSLWQVVAHVTDIHKIVDLFNVVARKNGIEPVNPPRVGLGLDLTWIAGMVGLVVLGAWWGVPMMLAASAQARYINGTGRNLRLSLSSRVFNILAQRRPVLHLTMPAAIRGACVQPDCTAILPAGAQFCQRCGSRVAAMV